MISWWCTDRTFWNWQNSKTNLQKLLFLINETENEETYLTIQTMSKKQVKMTQTLWKITIVKSIKQIIIINYSELYCQIIKIQKINNQLQVWFNHDCYEQIHKENILHIISWENESEESCLSIQTTHHCKLWSIYKNNI